VAFNVLSDVLELDKISTWNKHKTFFATRKNGEGASLLLLTFFSQKLETVINSVNPQWQKYMEQGSRLLCNLLPQKYPQRIEKWIEALVSNTKNDFQYALSASF